MAQLGDATRRRALLRLLRLCLVTPPAVIGGVLNMPVSQLGWSARESQSAAEQETASFFFLAEPTAVIGVVLNIPVR